MRQAYGITPEQQQRGEPAGGPPGCTEELLEDLGQVGRLEDVGITLGRWARLRGLPMKYAEALRGYLDQEEEEVNQKER